MLRGHLIHRAAHHRRLPPHTDLVQWLGAGAGCCTATARSEWLRLGAFVTGLNHDKQLLQKLERKRGLRQYSLEILVNLNQRFPLLLPALLERRVWVLLNCEVELQMIELVMGC